MSSPKMRSALGKLSVWAQVNHPVATSNLMRKLTSSSSHHHKEESPMGKIAGYEAANRAAGVPSLPTIDRNNGIELANRAARIPGCFEG